MKFTARKKDFLTAVKNASACISSKNILPILGNVLITAKEGKIEIAGTNLENRIEAAFEPVMIEAEGSATIPGKKLVTALSVFSGQDVLFEEIKEGLFALTCESATIELSGMDVKDFPGFSFDDSKSTKITLEGSELNECIKNTAFAVSLDDSRKVLQGILFKSDINEIHIIGTDGKRLAVAKMAYTVELEEFQAIIPSCTFAYIKLFPAGKLDIVISEKAISFSNDALKVYSKLIEGNYPNYQQVIPGNLDNKAVLSGSELINKIKVATVTTDATDNIINMTFNGKELILSSVSQNGKSKDKMPCEMDLAKEVSLNFNASFLLDALNACGEKVDFHFSNGDAAPVKFETADTLNVIMPIRKK